MPTCPVCGYPDLDEAPRSASGGGSYEICPSCGFQFGVDDDDKGISHEEWRRRWAEKGFPWWSRGIAMPEGWDAEAQLAGIASQDGEGGAKRARASKTTRVAKAAKASDKPAAKKTVRKKS